MRMTTAVILSMIALLPTLLPLASVDWWWVRIWDFPRLQLALLYLLGLGLLWTAAGKGWGRLGLAGVLALALLYQLTWIVPYLPLAPVQTQVATHADAEASMRIFIANVLMTNRAADRLHALIEHAEPDVLIFTEPDAWWADQLRGLAQTFLYRASHPLDNTYGMILYSRLPVVQSEVKFLVEPDIPSIHARLRLRSDALVELIAVHPRPPRPAVDTAERDAELILVGRQAKASRAPTIVAGDLNDVGWSQTTRLFQQVSGLLDPRRGRGLYATYHADYPVLRYPLDHLFHSREFRLRRMAVLDHFGSDHFPLLVELSYEPERQSEQELPRADEAERREAEEKLERVREER
jgi:endonuclease/exonuclease/phosphatase (EEP) superfamily protein YafD